MVTVAGHDRYTVGVQRFESVGDLTEAAFRVFQRRQAGKEPKTGDIFPHVFRAIVVAHPSQLAPRLDAGEPKVWRRERKHGHRDAVLIHFFQRLLRRPGQSTLEVGGWWRLLEIRRRDNVMVHVDPMGHGRDRPLPSPQQNCAQGSSATNDETPAAHHGALMLRPRTSRGMAISIDWAVIHALLQ